MASTPLRRITRALLLLGLIGAFLGCDDGAEPGAGGGDAAPMVDGGGGAGGGAPDQAVAAGELSVDPVVINLLGPVGEAATATVTLSNLGEGPLTIESVAFDPPVAVSPFRPGSVAGIRVDVTGFACIDQQRTPGGGRLFRCFIR